LSDDPAYAERAKAFASQVKDVSEFLASIDLVPPTQAVPMRVTYQDACHLVHGQGIRHQPRKLLAQIPGLQLIEMKDSDVCCGSAGIYNLTHPQMAGELLERKMDDIPEGVDAIVMGNPGCMLQIKVGVHRRGQQVDVLHTVELLDEAYRREEVSR
jgi:glycolate oxidase iron-sulfur subunit